MPSSLSRGDRGCGDVSINVSLKRSVFNRKGKGTCVLWPGSPLSIYTMAGAILQARSYDSYLYFGCATILCGRTPILWRCDPAADVLQPTFYRRSVAAGVCSRVSAGVLPEGVTRRLLRTQTAEAQ